MSKILDLTVFQEETLDITMPDGKLLHIIKPTQKMVIEMLKLKGIKADDDAEKIVKAFNSMVWCVLNSNDCGAKYDMAYVEQMPLKMKTAVINAYGEFIAGIQSNPNS